ncbi:hypothetical protein KSP39_PZI006357 [Platanthera zijinensis]|uniref:HMA domain-containing protein n=1 Tax=Platanthera zijinensis TaxID=2320716 RepID=A0AAP0BP25_9ASPA
MEGIHFTVRIECLLIRRIVVLKVSLHCTSTKCEDEVRKILRKEDGVYIVEVDSKSGKVTVKGNADAKTLIRRLQKAGKNAELWPEKERPAVTSHSPKPDIPRAESKGKTKSSPDFPPPSPPPAKKEGRILESGKGVAEIGAIPGMKKDRGSPISDYRQEGSPPDRRFPIDPRMRKHWESPISVDREEVAQIDDREESPERPDYAPYGKIGPDPEMKKDWELPSSDDDAPCGNGFGEIRDEDDEFASCSEMASPEMPPLPEGNLGEYGMRRRNRDAVQFK